jgi:hypothetical protein
MSKLCDSIECLPVGKIPSIIDWSTLYHYLLPSAPEIKFGEKDDGPPRWTKWLESWYVAYDPLIWQILERDDSVDERDQAMFWKEGLLLLAQDASEDIVCDVEKDHLECLADRLIRRERLYCTPFLARSLFKRRRSHEEASNPFSSPSPVLYLIRSRFINYHHSRDYSLTLPEILARAEDGDEKLFCPFPPMSSALSSVFLSRFPLISDDATSTVWPSYSPHPYGAHNYTLHRFVRDDPVHNRRLSIPPTPTHESERARAHYFAHRVQLCSGIAPPAEGAPLPPPMYDECTSSVSLSIEAPLPASTSDTETSKQSSLTASSRLARFHQRFPPPFM